MRQFVDSRPLRVLVLSPGGFGRSYHGPGASLSRLFSHLGGAVKVSIAMRSQGSSFVAPTLDSDQSRFREITTDRGNYVVGTATHIIRYRKNYDVILLSMCNLHTLVPALLARCFRLPVLLRIAADSEIPTAHPTTLKSIIKLRMMRSMNGYVTISSTIRTKVLSISKEQQKLFHIPNSVDTNRFFPAECAGKTAGAKASYSNTASTHVVLCVGSVSKRKGQKLLVEALSKCPASVSLRLVGPKVDDRYWNEIQAFVSEYKLDDRVSHKSFINDIENEYRAADFFVLPSEGEGMPNSMIEAMATGLIPIGTPVSGIKDLIAKNRGRFVGRNSDEIAKAILHYLNSPESMMVESKEIRNFILDQHDANVGAGRLLQALQSLKISTLSR